MRPLLAILVFLQVGACAGDEPDDDKVPTDADTDTDTDADTDTDTDSDTDTDTGEPPDTEAELRVIHASPTLPTQDLLGNGVPGNPGMVGLPWRHSFPPNGWVERPPNSYTFELFDSGAVTPWTSFPEELELARNHVIVIHGELDPVTPATARGALFLDEDLADIGADQVRIRWTHVAAPLAAAPVSLRDAVTGVTYTTLSYAGSEQVDLPPDVMRVYADIDDDGACDAGEAFEPFRRDAGEFFHVLLVADELGTLSLLGVAESADLAARAVVPCP